jgi:hypothetical protein
MSLKYDIFYKNLKSNVQELSDIDFSVQKSYYKKQAPFFDIFENGVRPEDQAITEIEDQAITEDCIISFFLKEFKINVSCIAKTNAASCYLYHLNFATLKDISKLQNILKAFNLRFSVKASYTESNLADIAIIVRKKSKQKILFFEVAKNINDVHKVCLPIFMGVDFNNNPVFADLAKMPHFGIFGSTGSGKSVAINSLLVSLLASKSVSELDLYLFDAKKTELSPFFVFPHTKKSVTEVNDAIACLSHLCDIMDERYSIIQSLGLRDKTSDMGYIVTVIDELADFVLQGGEEFTNKLVRLLQMGRACGIHVVLATQSPTSEIFSKLIRANVSARLCFKTSTSIESRIAINKNGAENFGGFGDGVFLFDKETRFQACFSGLAEIEKLKEHYL